MSTSDKSPLMNNQTPKGSAVAADDDPFLSLANTKQPSTTNSMTNSSRPRRYQSETLKSRLNLDQNENRSIIRQRFDDTTPSESTAETWATAASREGSSPSGLQISPTEDDTIKVRTLSHPSLDGHDDQTRQREISEGLMSKEMLSRRKMDSPSLTSPIPTSIASASMWDELEAIKRRIRQLELSHPSISGERPHTRGTTNSSSSPQRSSPFPSQAGTSITSASSPSSYPLLNAAITKVKASGLSIDIAQAIESTAQECISLAMLANPDPSSQPPSPRAIRKRVDGVCRGLTELCLALADQQQLSMRQQARVAQHRAEDAADSSPLSATGRQSMTLSRHSARRLSNGTTVSRAATTISRSRRPAQTVVGVEEFDDDGVSVVSRPGISRYSTVSYRPPSRAKTEVYREATPPTLPSLQRFPARRSLLSRHGPSMSDFNVPTSDQDLVDEPPMPHTATRSTFAPSSTSDPRRRSLNLQTYFSSPPRGGHSEYSSPSGIPTPPRPLSFISPPRVNAQSSASSSGERTSGTIRRRQGLNEKVYASTDVDEDVRSTTLGRTTSVRRIAATNAGGDLRRNSSISSRRYGNANGRSRENEEQS